MTDIKTLVEQIEKAGISSGDTVMIHSSLRAIGEIEGRAEGFIDMFTEYLSDGLFLVPTHTWKNVNRENPVFDVRETLPCIGTLPTVAAFHKEAARSLHPTHSLSAFGKRKEEYIENELNCHTPTPPHGAWGRLYKERAKILLVGVGHNRSTYIHAVEEMADIPNRLSESPVPFVTLDKYGNEHIQPSRTHYTPGTPDVSANFVKFSEYLEQNGATSKVKIGLADTIVCDAVRLTDLLLDLFEKAKRRKIDLCVDDRSLDDLFL